MDLEEETPSNNEIRPTSETNTLNDVTKLVCVQYPGIVKNVDKAIETLGGLEQLQIATGNVKTNLELNFRPTSLYSKPSVSEKDTKPLLLVKVRYKKSEENEKATNEVIDYNVVGMSALSFKFNRLCDFQYLPLLPKEPTEKEDQLEYIYKKIVPSTLPSANWINDNADVPLFFPPTTFSKLNSSNNSLHFERSNFYKGKFTEDTYQKIKQQHTHKRKENVTNCTHMLTFEEDIPQQPSAENVERLFRFTNGLDKLKELFEERPIWSRQALLYDTGFTVEQLKHILPKVAYYYLNGPWRVMWIRFGYNPKKDPNAKIYQTLDIRIRSSAGFKMKIRRKRPLVADLVKQSKFSLQNEIKLKNKKEVTENSFILRPNSMPAARQLFYQYCDIKLPEVEAMFARLPPTPSNAVCDKNNGWLPSGFALLCREIANKYIGEDIKNQFLKEKQDGEEKAQEEEPSIICDTYEVSDTSSSSSESEDENPPPNNQHDMEETDNEIDMETVDEVNKLVSGRKTPEQGPSSSF